MQYGGPLTGRLLGTMRGFTVNATTFIPLPFMVGVDGINLGNTTDTPRPIPGLNRYYDYPTTGRVMMGAGLRLSYLFKRKDGS